MDDQKVTFNFDTVAARAAQKIAFLNGELPPTDRLSFYFIGEMLRAGSQSVEVTPDNFGALFHRVGDFIREFQMRYPQDVGGGGNEAISDSPLFSHV